MAAILTLFLTLISSFPLMAIYGEDNRIEYYQTGNPKLQKLADAVAYQVERHRELKGWKFFKKWNLIMKPLHEKRICHDQKFSDQKALRTNCTGVLVGPKTLLTAGNCITEHYCWNDLYYWVFNYNLKSSDGFNHMHPRKDFYTCKKIIKRVYDPQNAKSYTLLELKKEVKGVTPVKLSDNSNLGIDDELITMGHVRGLPLKIAADTQVMDQNEELFILNSDISGESLGAPIFNAKTYELEGMMIYGSVNYDYQGSSCQIASQYQHKDAKELAIKTGFLKDLIP